MIGASNLDVHSNCFHLLEVYDEHRVQFSLFFDMSVVHMNFVFWSMSDYCQTEFLGYIQKPTFTSKSSKSARISVILEVAQMYSTSSQKMLCFWFPCVPT